MFEKDTFKTQNFELQSDYAEQEEIYAVVTDNLNEISLESSSGMGVSTIFPAPIKYIDDFGEVQFIDTTFEEIETTGISTFSTTSEEEVYKFGNRANSFEVGYPKNISTGISIDNTFYLSPIFDQDVQQEGFMDDGESKVIYPNAFGENTHIEYMNINSGIKENIILEKNIGRNRFSVSFKSDSHIPILTEDLQSISIVKKSDETTFDYYMSPIYIYDSFDIEKNPDEEYKHYNEDGTYELEQISENEYTITYVISEEFLDNPNTIYPVIIDPTVNVNNSSAVVGDTYVQQSSPNTSFYMQDFIRFGYYNGGRNYGYVYFPQLPYIGSGTITSANFTVSFRPNQSSGALGACYRVTSKKNNQDITWNNRPSDSTPKTTSSTYSFTRYSFDVTSTAKRWYNGSYPNYGFRFGYDNETYNDYNSVGSSDGESAFIPKMTITYTLPSTGSETSGIINGASYYFRNAYLGNKYLDLRENGTANGTNAQQFAFADYPSERWQTVYVGNGYYKIRSIIASPRVLDGRASCVSGAQVVIYDNVTCDEQLWRITRTGDGRYKFSPKKNLNLSLAVENPSSGNNAKVKLFTSKSSSAQEWTLERVNFGAAGGYKQENSTQINCAGYATKINKYLTGQLLNVKTGDSVDIVATRITSYVNNYYSKNMTRVRGYNLAPNYSIASNEYRVALRVVESGGAYDYHFYVQINTGEWAHKLGGSQSQNLGFINPSTASWTHGGHTYNSSTVYFRMGG